MSTSRWAGVDWSKSTSAIAAEKGVAGCTVSKARRRYAPETLGAYSTRSKDAPVDDLQKRLKAATARADGLQRELDQARKQLAIARRAFATTEALMRDILDERDAALARLSGPSAAAPHRKASAPQPPAPKRTPARAARLNRWTPAELDILRATYPEGAAATAKALEAAGSPPRTLATIRTRAQRLGITNRPTHPKTDEAERERILTLLNDYGGLPLTQEDFIDELHIPRHRAREHLEHLVTTERITAKPDPSFDGRGRATTLYFPQEANA